MGTLGALRLKQVSALIQVLQEMKLTTVQHVERRYHEIAPDFSAVAGFLMDIGAIHESRGRLVLDPKRGAPLVFASGPAFRRILLELILQKDTIYRQEILKYLSGFDIHDGEAVFRPRQDRTGDNSAVRNFLMDIGVVRFDELTGSYLVDPENLSVFVCAKTEYTRLAPEGLRTASRRMEELGLAAEKAVVDYERERTGPRFAGLIDHVAIRNIAAGFDVKSCTLVNDAQVLPRLIEVKAVSADDYGFYWTRNERQVAQAFGAWYFLYLLPATQGRVFDLGALRVIANPVAVLRDPQNTWILEEDVIHCRLASEESEERDTAGRRCRV